MFGILSILTGLFAGSKIIKENLEPVAPPIENFDLYQKDILDGVDSKTLYKNQLNGRYRKPLWADNPMEVDDLNAYTKDRWEYGLEKANMWAKQGKYKENPNLHPEELYYRDSWCGKPIYYLKEDYYRVLDNGHTVYYPKKEIKPYRDFEEYYICAKRKEFYPFNMYLINGEPHNIILSKWFGDEDFYVRTSQDMFEFNEEHGLSLPLV